MSTILQVTLLINKNYFVSVISVCTKCQLKIKTQILATPKPSHIHFIGEYVKGKRGLNELITLLVES